MKCKIFLTLLLLVFTQSFTQAQTIHAILVGDLSPAAGFGKYSMAVAMDLRLMYSMLHSNMPERQLNILQLEIDEDEWSNPQNILDAIAEVSPKPEDTVLFYFSGHGAADDRGHYLELANGKLYRDQILQAMENKRARLNVLITDCCNTRSDGYAYGAPFIHTENPRSPTVVFRSLFLEPRGQVNINSSQPGESAFFLPIDDKEESYSLSNSIFTGELIEWIHENRNRSSNWESLVRAVSLKVHAAFLKHYPNGASVGKGNIVQKQQNLFSFFHPGRPEASGPRTGLIIRDFAGRGAVIVEVTPSSPATQVFRLDLERMISLEPQQVVISVNGLPTADTEAALKAIQTAPQITRLGIRDRTGRSFDALIKLRY
jgi:hypothetical protein